MDVHDLFCESIVSNSTSTSLLDDSKATEDSRLLGSDIFGTSDINFYHENRLSYVHSDEIAFTKLWAWNWPTFPRGLGDC
jgi:hypothetical protein